MKRLYIGDSDNSSNNGGNGTVVSKAVPSPFSVIGSSGIKIQGGIVQEEFLPQLKGSRGLKIYREMRDNDATIASMLFAVEMVLRRVRWRVEPNTENESEEIQQAHQDAADFIQGALFEDMEISWDEFLTEVLSMLVYGWAYFEVIYKRRMGPEIEDPTKTSRFDDGKIGIRKIQIIAQESLFKWELSDDGTLLGLWQQAPSGVGGSRLRFIPIEKALLFRPRLNRGSPEGQSVIRGAYRSWYYTKRIQEIEAIAIERELNGLPVMYIPQEVLKASEDGDTSAKAAVTAYEQIIRDVKFNEQGGLILPSNPYMDQDGKYSSAKQVEFDLVSAKGTRAIDTDKVLRRYATNIAQVVLADFIMLGTNKVGAYNLGESKTKLFLLAVQGWLESIAEVLNRKFLPALWRLNAFDFAVLPKVVPGDVEPDDLGVLGEYLEKLSRAGMPLFPDEKLEEFLREKADLPERTPEEELINV